MKDKILSLLLSLLLVSLVFQLSGCSLNFPVGDSYTFDYSKGSTTSNHLEPRQIVITGDKSLNIKSGKKVVVILKSGQVIKGKYFAMIPISAEVYSDRYQARREQDKEVGSLPDLGDSLTLLLSDGNKYEGDFFGFDFGAIRFRKRNSTTIGTWYLRTLNSLVDKEGRRIESDTLGLLMKEGKVPFLSAIVLRIKKEESRLELDDVSQIQIAPPKKNTTFKYAAVIIISIAFVYLFIHGLREAIAQGLAGVIE